MNLGLATCAIVGAILTALGAAFDLQATLRAWLLASLLGIALPLGALPLLMTHNLTGGRWGDAVRGPLKSIAAILPLALLLFLPLLIAANTLFTWNAADVPDVVQAKHFYLNLPFFVVRFLLYSATWLYLAMRLNVWRDEQRRPQRASAAGLVLWGITVTFFSFDWIMALEPSWYSDIFGFVFMASLLSMAPALLFILPAVPWDTLARGDRDGARRDLALLWLAAMLFWLFVSFSQYLVIWSGDLPHEIGWYLHRDQGGWQWFALAALLLCAALPLVVLLPAGWQHRGKTVTVLASLVLAGHVLEFAWLVLPAYYPTRVQAGWRSPVAITVIAACSLAVYARHRQRSLARAAHRA